MRFNKEETKKFTFIKRENLGKCPCCDKEVHNDQLYVEEDKNVYHYSCYNYMKAEDDGING